VDEEFRLPGMVRWLSGGLRALEGREERSRGRSESGTPGSRTNTPCALDGAPETSPASPAPLQGALHLYTRNPGGASLARGWSLPPLRGAVFRRGVWWSDAGRL